jgi:hypothetical protein
MRKQLFFVCITIALAFAGNNIAAMNIFGSSNDPDHVYQVKPTSAQTFFAQVLFFCGAGVWLCREVGCCRRVTDCCDDCQEATIDTIERMSQIFLQHMPDPAVAMGDAREHGQ